MRASRKLVCRGLSPTASFDRRRSKIYFSVIRRDEIISNFICLPHVHRCRFSTHQRQAHHNKLSVGFISLMHYQNIGRAMQKRAPIAVEWDNG
jgi:pyoverdine/dityrosine biosynthesis protein Dit1